MFQKLKDYINSLEVESIPFERKQVLAPFIDYLHEQVNTSQSISLIFICTHNSRRSHFSQIWAQAMSEYFGFHQITCYSGGTAATTVYPMTIQVLEAAGFHITKLSEEMNPIIALKYSDRKHPVIFFSKTYNHVFNPSIKFTALMTCSDADEKCPFIPGAEKRLVLNYEDPKKFDNSPEEEKKYEERSQQIATEMYYVFSKITNA